MLGTKFGQKFSFKKRANPRASKETPKICEANRVSIASEPQGSKLYQIMENVGAKS